MLKNPHRIYQQNKVNTASGKGIEIAVLETASARLRPCQGSWPAEGFNRELDEALRFNQRLWDVLQTDWSQPSCKLPEKLRADLLSLSVFVRRTTFDIMAKPAREKLDVLIGINENLSKGLRGQAPREPHPALG